MIRLQSTCTSSVFTRLFIIGLFISGLGYGQDFRPNALPPSPDASALGKYAEIPVGYYTGTPNIDIPLYTISDGNLKVPVSLSYHAMGNRIEDVATYAGLAWTLNAGGVVTRSVRSRPDDDATNGFLDYTTTIAFNDLASTTNYNEPKLTLLKQIADGYKDTEPDAYFFNFNGFSGSFTFDWGGANIITDSKVAWKIKLLKELPSFPAKITGWEFTGDDGTIYTFKGAETTTVTTTTTSSLLNQNYNSAWYLTNITTANKNRSINLTYEGYDLSMGYNLFISSTVSYGEGGNCGQQITENYSNSYTKLSYNGKRISTIASSDNATIISFLYNTLRTDEQGATMKSLDEINIKNKDNAQVKKYSLLYDYSTGRLTLKSITEQNNGNVKPPYMFNYNSTRLPPRVPINGTINEYNSTLSQDHWGFYNGAFNKTLVPPSTNFFLSSNTVRRFEGADRNPNAEYMKAGILTSITYPTGGIDKYTYEPHDYGFIQNATVLSKGEYVKERRVVTVEANGNVSTITSQPFVVEGNTNEATFVVQINVNGKKINSSVNYALDPRIELIDINGNVVSPKIYVDYNSGVESQKFDERLLPAGTYRLRAYCNNSSEFVRAYMEWTGRKIINGNPIPTLKKMTGGLRIKEINRFAYEGDPLYSTRQFIYTFQGDTSKSSGALTSEPFYEIANNASYQLIIPMPLNFPYESNCGYLLRLSQNKAILSTTAGSHVGYREVTELSGAGGINGKNVYNFTSQFEHYDYVPPSKPFAPVNSAAYYNGQLLNQKTYKNVNGTLSLVAESASAYTSYLTSVRGYKVSFDGGILTPYNIAYFNKFQRDPYFVSMGRAQPIEIISTETPTEGGTPVTKKTQFSYDSKLQYLKIKSVYLNDAYDKDQEFYYYPNDFLSPTSTINTLKTKNIIGTPLEVISQRVKNGVVSTTGAVYTSYATDGSSRIFPSEIKKPQLAAPVINFDFAYDNSNGAIDARYATEITFDKYDAKENISQYTYKDGITTSLLWDKHNSNPIAAINNATPEQVAYTGFEDIIPATFGASWSVSGTYSSTEFATGKRSLTAGGATVNTSSLPAVRYSLSFWRKGSCTLLINGAAQTVPASADWNVFEIKFNGGQSVSITVSANSFIDEVRIVPIDAQMSTYAYEQLVGVNTIADARSNPTLFNYDNLGRLHFIKDHNKDIVKRINYEYDVLSTANASFTLSSTLSASYTFQFQVLGTTNPAYTYEWDFGDGTTQTTTTNSVTHLYPGLTLNYTVKVNVKNSANTLAGFQAAILVKKTSGSSTLCNEISGFTAIKAVAPPYRYNFDAPNPPISGATYTWDFGEADANCTGLSCYYVYSGAGKRVVSLTVTVGGQSCIKSKDVLVQ